MQGDYSIQDINPYIIHCGSVSRTNCPPPGTVYEERRVRWYELELIIWGEGSVVTEGKKLEAVRGNLFFRKPGMIVQGISPYYCYMIIFDMLKCGGRVPLYSDVDFLNIANLNNAEYECFAKENFTDFDLPPVIRIQQQAKLEELFSQAFDCYVEYGAKGQFFLKTYLMQILMPAFKEWQTAKILQNPSRSVCTNYSAIIGVKKYIDGHSGEQFTLGALADMANLSPNFFCRVFREIVGDNVIAYVNRCKIRDAKKSLIDTNKAVKEISFEYGFENETYFYTLFKKLEGITPSEFRVQHRKLIQ